MKGLNINQLFLFQAEVLLQAALRWETNTKEWFKTFYFRLVLNPYDWSSFKNISVNICLISAIWMSSILFQISTERLSWKDWHEWMKRNAEVATNIRRQNSEIGSEEVNRQSCCSCMRRFLDIPVVRILVTVLLGLWPAGDRSDNSVLSPE